jgi:hypothetical protein
MINMDHIYGSHIWNLVQVYDRYEAKTNQEQNVSMQMKMISA